MLWSTLLTVTRLGSNSQSVNKPFVSWNNWYCVRCRTNCVTSHCFEVISMFLRDEGKQHALALLSSVGEKKRLLRWSGILHAFSRWREIDGSHTIRRFSAVMQQRASEHQRTSSVVVFRHRFELRFGPCPKTNPGPNPESFNRFGTRCRDTFQVEKVTNHLRCLTFPNVHSHDQITDNQKLNENSSTANHCAIHELSTF